MSLEKNDFALVHAFVDNNNPKWELDYAFLSSDGLYATDTRKAIRLCIGHQNVNDSLVHKQLLKCLVSMAAKKQEMSINGDIVSISSDLIKLSTIEYDFAYPDIKAIINQDTFKETFELENIDDIQFELVQRECYISDTHLNSLIKFTDCDKYIVSYNKQTDEDSGQVKISGIKITDEEGDKLHFETVITGRGFKLKAKELLKQTV